MTNLKLFIEDIHQRISVSSVVRENVALTKKGREYQGLCPFHNEKTPSFYVNDEKGFYHCFGCGAHGDSISFLEKIQKLSFMEALQKLAQKCGLQVPKDVVASPSSSQSEEHDRLRKCMYEAAAFFYRTLVQDKQASAWAYLMSRGITNDDIRTFGLGYAPSGNALAQHLLAKGFQRQELMDAGLLVTIESESRDYPRFRDRIIFPIWDRHNRIIAFGGRSLGSDLPKYMNSPETLIFHKGKTLYGLSHALKQKKPDNGFYVVEGYMDVIRMHQAGIPHAVAPLGTAMTEDQCLLLWKYTPHITLCFDGDSAGRMAAKRAVERALPFIGPDKQIHVLTLPQGEDPDSYLRKNSADSFRALPSLPLSQYLWEQALSEQVMDTPESRVKMRNELFANSAKIHDAQMRKAYEDFFMSQMRSTQSPPVAFSGNRSKKNVNHEIPHVLLDHMSILTLVLLKALIIRPEILNDLIENLLSLDLTDIHACEIRDLLIECASSDAAPSLIAATIDQSASREARAWLNQPKSSIHLGQFEKTQSPTAYRKAWLEMLANLQTLKNLEEDLKLAYKELHTSMSNEAWDKLKALQESVMALRRTESSDI